MKNRPDIHFWHIPKTAGTSLAGLIRRAYPASECIPAHTVRELAVMPPEAVRRYRCYTGHFFSLLEPLVGRPLPTVTVLRNPIRQTLSLLGHCKRSVSGAGFSAPLMARLLPMLWQGCPLWRTRIERAWCPVLMNNFQTRVLGSDIPLPKNLPLNFYGLTYPFMETSFCSSQADLDQIYLRAVERLESMVVVGTVERLSETVGRICDFLDIAAPANLPKENTSTYRTKPSAAFLKLVEKQNAYDLKLHALATGLIDTRM